MGTKVEIGMVCHYCNNYNNRYYSNLSLFRWWLRVSCIDCSSNLACVDMCLGLILLVCLWNFSFWIEEKELLRIRKTKERPRTLLQVLSLAKCITLNNLNNFTFCSYILWWIWVIYGWVDVDCVIGFSYLCFVCGCEV